MSSKIYIVMGHINEHGDEDSWVEDLFDNEEQAKACCKYKNITKLQKNVDFYLCEHDGFCHYDYMSELKSLSEPFKEITEPEIAKMFNIPLEKAHTVECIAKDDVHRFITLKRIKEDEFIKKYCIICPNWKGTSTIVPNGSCTKCKEAINAKWR